MASGGPSQPIDQTPSCGLRVPPATHSLRVFLVCLRLCACQWQSTPGDLPVVSGQPHAITGRSLSQPPLSAGLFFGWREGRPFEASLWRVQSGWSAVEGGQKCWQG